jgi:hypothetical protein
MLEGICISPSKTAPDGIKTPGALRVMGHFLVSIRPFPLRRILSLFTCEASNHGFGKKSKH